MPALDDPLRTLSEELEGLLADLREEAALLAAGQADALPAVTARKAPRVTRIGQLWHALAASLGLGEDADPGQVGDRLARGEATGAAARAWPDIASRAREVARQNQLNGLLVQEQLRHAHAAMRILQDTARRGGLYGADGQSLAVFSNPRKLDEV